MLRALLTVAFVCAYCGMLPLVATDSSEESSTQMGTTTVTTEAPSEEKDSESSDSSSSSSEERYYHPAEDRKPKVLEEFNRQYVDGSYEFKYVLSNGVSRYEKAFWKYLKDGKKLLARKGFYSHPLTNHKFLTVFYTADENGYVQDTTKYTNVIPTLPKYLEIPQQEPSHETSTTTTSTTTTTTTTQKPTTTKKMAATKRPLVKPSEPNWIY